MTYFPPKDSPESDYGVWWSDNGKKFPKYRVSYVKTTGEVYAINLATLDTELLGVVQPDYDELDDGTVTGNYYRTLDRILTGWSDHCGVDEMGVTWVRNRLAENGAAL